MRGNPKRQRLEDSGNTASGILSPLLRCPQTQRWARGSPTQAAVQSQACAPDRLHALRIVNDGAVGSRAGDGWEAQVHKVSLLPGADTEQGHSKLSLCSSSTRSTVFSTNTHLRNSSALSAAEISVTPPLGTYK